MAPIRQSRPVSTATDLTDFTDFTHATDEPIEADPDNRSLRSADFEVDTESLTESVKGVVHEYGRTYQQWRAGAYPFPNDEDEYDRLGWQHLLIKCLLRNRNWFAPVKSLPSKYPKRVLDIGCGTGQWCREIAKEFPRSRVEGIDLSKPPNKFLQDSPENLHFNMDDIRHRMWWGLANDYTYDFIHTRMSLGIYPDFREIIQKSFNNLEPGGYMESQELDSKVFCDDGTMPDNWPLLEWSNDQNEAAHHKLGRPLRIAPRLKTWYEQAGFVDVKEEIFRIPINAWAKDPWLKMMGVFMAVNMRDGLYGFSVNYFHRAWGWTVPEIRARLVPVYDSLKDNSVHAYFKVYVVHGRRPRKDEPPSQVPKPDTWPTEDNCYNDKAI